MTNFWWIRHAPVIGNDDCCYGSNEVNCDLSNTKRFKTIASCLPKKGIVYSSPLSRAKKTYMMSKKNGLCIKRYKLDIRLTEQNLGEWTGMKYKDLEKLTKKLNVYSPNWLMDGKYKPPGGESFIELTKRVKSFIEEMIRKFPKENIIIFSHGGPIRAALSLALEFNKGKVVPIEISNLSITHINYFKRNWCIQRTNY